MNLPSRNWIIRIAALLLLVVGIGILHHSASKQPQPQSQAQRSGGMSVRATASGVTLSWAPSTTPGVANYSVWRGTVSGGPYNRLVVPSAITSYTDTAVTPGATYYYVGTATLNGSESGFSNEVSAAIPGTPPPPPPTSTFVGSVTPTTLSFSSTGGSVPATQQLTIVSTPPNATPFTVSCSAAWCGVTPGSGTTKGVITVSATPGTLAAGTYNANVSFVSAQFSNSPVVVPVTFTVSAVTPPPSTTETITITCTRANSSAAWACTWK